MAEPPGPSAFPPPPGPQDQGSSGPFAPPPSNPMPPPGAPVRGAPPTVPPAPGAPQPLADRPAPGWSAGPAGPVTTPTSIQVGSGPSATKSRTSMYVVLGIAAAVVLAVVGVLVFAGGDDDERDASDDTEQTDAPEGTADTEPVEETEPPATTEPADRAPADTEAPVDTTVVNTDGEFEDSADQPSGDVIAGAPAGQAGTREAPVPLGGIADIGDGWRLQVLDVVADATPIVMGANDFNEPPPPGSTFTIVRIALGYFGLEDPASFFLPTISGVGAAAVGLDTNCGVVPGEIDLFNDAFAGGVAVGNICFVTTPADPPVLQLYASGNFFFDTEAFLDATAPPAPIAPFPAVTGPQPGAAATPARTTGAAPVGAATDVGEGWAFAVVSPARDITDQVLTDNTFNDAPPEGFRFVGVEVAMAFSGEGSGSAFDVTASFVGNGNVQRGGFCGVVEGEIDAFADVFAGGSLTGTMCFVVPQDEVVGGVLYVTGGFDSDPVYFTTS